MIEREREWEREDYLNCREKSGDIRMRVIERGRVEEGRDQENWCL